jgi:hypothetical protein
MEDDAPKSAVELAMARFRKQDADAGVSETPMTAEQKAEIADVRQTYSAKLAQEEILYKTKLHASVDFDERQKMEENYRRDVERINHERDRKIDKLRQKPGA